MCRGNKGVRRNDDFPGQPQGADGNFQCNGAIAHSDAVAHSMKFGYAVFKFLNQWPIVGKLLVVQYLVHPIQKRLTVADIGLADVQGLRKSRHGSMSGWFLYGLILFHLGLHADWGDSSL